MSTSPNDSPHRYTASRAFRCCKQESSDEDTAGDTLLGQDVVYLKYVRLGEVKLNVTASGLKIMRFRNLKVVQCYPLDGFRR